jgi:hypothetical protein
MSWNCTWECALEIQEKIQINVIEIKVYNNAENALEITGKIRSTALELKGTVWQNAQQI